MEKEKEKELHDKVMDAVTGSKLREIGLEVLSLAPDSVKQKNGAGELKKKIDNAIDAT